MLKNLFITGLITVLPIAFTYIIIKFILDLITSPFIELYSFYLEPKIIGFIPQYAYSTMIVVKQISILMIVIMMILAMGLLVKYILSPGINDFFSDLANRVPLLNTVYLTVKQVISSIFKTDSVSFKQVVLVPFQGGFSYGLITGSPDKRSNLVFVFIPTAPSPISGFLVAYNKEDIKYSDLSVNHLFRHIVSLGLISDNEEPK